MLNFCSFLTIKLAWKSCHFFLTKIIVKWKVIEENSRLILDKEILMLWTALAQAKHNYRNTLAIFHEKILKYSTFAEDGAMLATEHAIQICEPAKRSICN